MQYGLPATSGLTFSARKGENRMALDLQP